MTDSEARRSERATEQNIDHNTGTALSTDVSERQGDIGPNVLRLNIEEQREELAETMSLIRRKFNAGAFVAAVVAISTVIIGTVVVAVVVSNRHRHDDDIDPGGHRGR